MIQLNSQAESEFSLLPSFSSIQPLSGLEDAHPLWGGPSALRSPSISMLISSRNSLTDTNRNQV